MIEKFLIFHDTLFTWYLIRNENSIFVFEKCAYWGYNTLVASQCSDLNGKGGKHNVHM